MLDFLDSAGLNIIHNFHAISRGKLSSAWCQRSLNRSGSALLSVVTVPHLDLGWMEGSTFLWTANECQKNTTNSYSFRGREIQVWAIGAVFSTNCHTPANHEIVCIVLRNDPIERAAHLKPPELEFDLEQYPDAEENGYLFITSISLQFMPDFGTPRTGTYTTVQY